VRGEGSEHATVAETVLLTHLGRSAEAIRADRICAITDHPLRREAGEERGTWRYTFGIS